MYCIKYIIADDHTIFRQGLKFALSDDPHFELLGEASTGIELLSVLSRETPDIILLDLKMPEMDGMTAMQEITKRYPSIKVIIVTMHDDEQFVLHLLEMGANGYLVKNADGDEIKLAMRCCYEEGHYFNKYVSNIMLKKLVHRDNDSLMNSKKALLTEKEIEILRLICEGHTAVEIGKRVFLSNRTVEGIKTILLEKVGVGNTAGLIKYAVKNGIVS